MALLKNLPILFGQRNKRTEPQEGVPVLNCLHLPEGGEGGERWPPPLTSPSCLSLPYTATIDCFQPVQIELCIALAVKSKSKAGHISGPFAWSLTLPDARRVAGEPSFLNGNSLALLLESCKSWAGREALKLNNPLCIVRGIQNGLAPFASLQGQGRPSRSEACGRV